jgi:hypothetical protein
VIAVVGSPSFAPGASPGDAGDAGGLAARIARAAAEAGAEVQLVGRVGDDPAGDAVLLALARGGVRHHALLRDAGQATPIEPPAAAASDPDDGEPIGALLAEVGDAGDVRGRTDGRVGTYVPGLSLDVADIALGLRYVGDFRVLVAADALDEPGAIAVADAAAFVGAALIVIAGHGEPASGAPGGAIVLEAPEADPGGVFAALVGRLAAAMDRGVDAAEAFRAATAEGGWERAAG